MAQMISMTQVATLFAWALAIAWLWQAATALNGMRHLPDLTELDPATLPELEPGESPHLTIIVPALNEEGSIAATLEVSAKKRDRTHRSGCIDRKNRKCGAEHFRDARLRA